MEEAQGKGENQVAWYTIKRGIFAGYYKHETRDRARRHGIGTLIPFQ